MAAEMDYETKFERLINLADLETAKATAAEIKILCDQVIQPNEKKGGAASTAIDSSLISSNPVLDELFSNLFADPARVNPTKFEPVLLNLIAGGMEYEKFKELVQKYDSSAACGLVWTPNFVAYRCRTCGYSPCMSMCTDCFKAGNHDGHDFNMFRSQAGGACDCGDPDVMKEEGFCSRHGRANAARRKLSPPPGKMLSIFQFVLPCLLKLFIIRCRRMIIEVIDIKQDMDHVIASTDPIIAVLQSLADLGTLTRDIMASVLISKQIYAKEMVERYKPSCVENGLGRAIDTLPNLCTPEDAANMDSPELCDRLKHSSFIEEMTFWLVRLQFPQSQVTFLLSLLSIDEYKAAFADSFSVHYGHTAALMVKQDSTDQLSNRIIHISVQLLSNEQLSLKLVQDRKLLRIMVISLNNMLKECLVSSGIHCDNIEVNQHAVVNCDSPIMSQHNYWGLVSDLHNMLGHDRIAHIFLRDPHLVDLWCSVLTAFQGMNLTERLLERHIEYESRAYYAAFTAEMECCATTLWALVLNCKNEASFDCIQAMTQALVGAIGEWFEAIQFRPDSCWKPPPLQISFHLPLHRYLAVFIRQAIALKCPLTFPSENLFRMIFMHPLQIQVARSEIGSQMWVRNGATVRYQCFLYTQCHFCVGLIDADLYLMQLCCSRVHPEWIILTLFERFHLANWLSFHPAKPSKPHLSPDVEMPMMEAVLRLLATLIGNICSLGMPERDEVRLELATLLAVEDRTHSQLSDQLPNKGLMYSPTKEVEAVLAEIAEYKEPRLEYGGMTQGKFVPKDILWDKHYDPLFVILRSMQLKEFQGSMSRYVDNLRARGKWTKKGDPWMPLRVPANLPNDAYAGLRRILLTRSLHAILYKIFYEALKSQAVSEQVVQLALYLTELAVHFSNESSEQLDAREEQSQPSFNTVLDLHFCGWYSGGDIFTNLVHKIDRILCVDDFPGLSRSISRDADATFPDLARMNKAGRKFSATPKSPSDESLALVSTGHDIPFIDSEQREVYDPDLYYNRIYKSLPPSLLRPFLHGPPARLAISYHCGSMSATSPSTSTSSTQTGQPVGVGPSGVVGVQTDPQMLSTNASGTAEPIDLNSLQMLGTSSTDMELHSPHLGYAVEEVGSFDSDMNMDESSMPLELSSPNGQYTVDLYNDPEAVECPEKEEQKKLPESSAPPRALPSPTIHVTETGGDSMLALLIRLHDQYARKLGVQNYRPPVSAAGFKPVSSASINAAVTTECMEENVPGDGVDVTKKLIDKIYTSSDRCRSVLDKMFAITIREESKIDDKGEKSASTSSSIPSAESREARKRLARERQQKLMARLQTHQKEVMEQILVKEQSRMNVSGQNDPIRSEPSSPTSPANEVDEDEETFTCVICSQTAGPSTTEPICLIVFCQSTTVLSKSVKSGCDSWDIMNRGAFRPAETRECFERDMTLKLSKHFDPVSCAASINLGSGNGVRVMTCGHHIHAQCHASYIAALKRDSSQMSNQLQMLQIESEFFCPLCRQLSNGILPLIPLKIARKNRCRHPKICNFNLGNSSKESKDVNSAMEHILECLDSVETTGFENTNLASSRETFVISLCNVLPLTFESFVKSTEAFPMLLCSIVRCNIELDILLSEADHQGFRRSISEQLVDLVSYQLIEVSQINDNWSTQLWRNLVGLFGPAGQDQDSMDTLASVGIQRCPLLLCDPVNVLIMLTLRMLPCCRETDCVDNLVRSCFNLQFVSGCFRALAALSAAVRRRLADQVIVLFDRDHKTDLTDEVATDRLLGLVILFSAAKDVFDDCSMIDEIELSEESDPPALYDLLAQIKADSVPFLKFSYVFTNAVKRRDIKRRPIPSTFDALISCWWPGGDKTLKLRWACNPMKILFGNWRWQGNDPVGAGAPVEHQTPEQSVSVCDNAWFDSIHFSKRQLPQRFYLKISSSWKVWQVPRLLTLPESYDTIFQTYHATVCPRCSKVPKELLICLICGTLVCRDECCMIGNLTELEAHAIECGSGVCVLLNVASSFITVVRQRRSANWGSVYLDTFGEEDKGLKRGKPLSLCHSGYALLQAQWLTHNLDSACKRWSWLNGNPNPEVIPIPMNL